MQPSVYGTDNSCTLDALRRLGPRARGVAVTDTRIRENELRRLKRLPVALVVDHFGWRNRRTKYAISRRSFGKEIPT